MAWQVDTSHTHINFHVRHMMVAKVRGEFQKYNLVVNFDEAQPSNSTVFVEIDASSINTRDAQRDGHLTSPDFLNVGEYPYLTFRSKRVEQIDAQTGRLIGDLTIRDVTREVVLNVDYSGVAKSPWGTTTAGFCGTTTINRKDWGLTWNQTLETGGVLVGDQIAIDIDVELVKVPETESVAA
jgi:polyisoprenoid-binding protein YceI